jgi:hypothetical protein
LVRAAVAAGMTTARPMHSSASMSIVGLLVLLVVVGVCLYLVNQYVPMAAPIKTIINVVVVLVVVVWLLNAFGLLDSGQRIRFRN